MSNVIKRESDFIEILLSNSHGTGLIAGRSWVSCSRSSGGLRWTNDRYSSKSYAIFIIPPKSNGAEKATCCISSPAAEAVSAHAPVRVRFVTPLAYTRSCDWTTAAT